MMCNNKTAKEIGGYMELERNTGPMLHEDAIALNSARNCLAYLIEARNIRKIALPYYLCDSVASKCRELGVQIRYYAVNENLLPANMEAPEDEWFYLVNYYGQLSTEQIKRYKEINPRLIVDNVQAYFDEPVPGVDTIYTCRKFFGVADGAFLYTDSRIGRELERDVSFDRMEYLFARYDTNASDHYADYVAHEQSVENLPLRHMSNLTENLLRGIDYDQVRTRRTANFNYLAERLGRFNRLNLRSVEGAFAYPLWIEDGADVRRRLIAEKIYVPTLWPDVICDTRADSLARELAADVLPIPCDQRYTENEMQFICDLISIKKEHEWPENQTGMPWSIAI